MVVSSRYGGAILSFQAAFCKYHTKRAPERTFQIGHGIEAVVDTGFDGSLTLPRSMISLLGLPWRRRGRALLGDGGESVFDIYEGIVVWDGQPRRIAMDEAATASLIGMSLLEGYALTVQVRSGGTVTIALLP